MWLRMVAVDPEEAPTQPMMMMNGRKACTSMTRPETTIPGDHKATASFTVGSSKSASTRASRGGRVPWDTTTRLPTVGLMVVAGP